MIMSLFGLFGCDAVGLRELKPGVSTGFDVRDKMGTPTMEWKNDDGSLTWEFARTPEGKENYMITIGPDNILREIRQVLTEENFAKVEKGMTKDQIRRLLGKPAGMQRFDLKKQEVWDWKFKNPHNVELYFNVHFDESGRVVETSRREEHRG
jgi:outer membrane protein assembly factor BamE (lipoprotein component of BamABCDE complex)